MPSWMYTDKQPCGTYAAYRRHLYYGESPCRPCREASAERARVGYRAKARAKPPRVQEPAGWQPGFAVDVMALLDVCEAIEPEWDREAAMGDTF